MASDQSRGSSADIHPSVIDFDLGRTVVLDDAASDALEQDPIERMNQVLTSLTIQMQVLERSLNDPATARALMASMKATVADAIDTLRSAGQEVRPALAERTDEVEHNRDTGLSGRELEVLAFIAGGATNDDIAKALYLSEKTVKSHLSSIFRKLGVTNRTQAASKAIRERMVQLPD